MESWADVRIGYGFYIEEAKGMGACYSFQRLNHKVRNDFGNSVDRTSVLIFYIKPELGTML